MKTKKSQNEEEEIASLRPRGGRVTMSVCARIGTGEQKATFLESTKFNRCSMFNYSTREARARTEHEHPA